MCVDELPVKDSHSHQVGCVAFGPVLTLRRMTGEMKDYWYLVEEVVMEASIPPSEGSVARSVSDSHFASYLEKQVNWKVCAGHYFEGALSYCVPN